MDGKNLETLFAERGFVIKNPTVFTKEADNVDLTELVDRLTNLEKKINSSANIVDFAKNILGKLDELESIVNLDEYARLSDSGKIDAYNKDIKEMRAYFAKVQSFIRAEENMVFQKQNMFDAMRKIYDLDKNKSLDDATRTSETLRLYGEKKACEAAYNKAYQTFIEQRKAYNDSVRGFSLVGFKNELLATINIIQIDCKDLALSPESKEKLQVTISDIRNDIAYYGLESIRSKTEFDALCKRFGIEASSNKKVAEITSTKEPKREELNKTEVHPEYSGPVKAGEELAPVTKNEIKSEKSVKDRVKDVYEKLKELNPGVEFKIVDEPTNPRFDGRIDASEFVTNLHLPEGFYYMNNGISNKYSNTNEPVIIEVGKLERIAKLEDTPVQETTPKEVELETAKPSLFDRAASAIDKLRQKGRVESGKKYKVTKSRNALIGSYPKSLLTFTAIGAVIGGITLSPIVPAAAIGAGLGAVVTTLYRKLTKNTDAKVDELEIPSAEITPENAPTIIRGFYKAADKLMDIYKKRKSGEIAPKKEEVVVDVAERPKTSEEQLEELSENIRRALAEHQDTKEDILNDAPSMGGR